MAVVAVGVVAVLGAAVFWLLGHRRGSILAGSDALGILPAIPGETRSIEEIQAATADPEPAVRREALRSLGRLEDHRKLPAADVLPFLTKGAQDTDASVRALATAYLGQVRVDPGAVVPLLVGHCRTSATPVTSLRRSGESCLPRKRRRGRAAWACR
jgi:hypothetical protein